MSDDHEAESAEVYYIASYDIRILHKYLLYGHGRIFERKHNVQLIAIISDT